VTAVILTDEGRHVDTNATNIETFQGEDEQWYWRAKGANGEIVAQGEGHGRHEDAVRAAGEVFPGVPIDQ